MTKQDVRFYESRITHFEKDIQTEIDLLFETDKLFFRRPHERFQNSKQHKRFRTAKGRRVSPEPNPCPLGEDEGGPLDEDGEQENEDEDEKFSITRAVDCFPTALRSVVKTRCLTFKM